MVKPLELVGLMVWLCAPALVVTVMVELSFLAHRGLLKVLGWWRVALSLLGTCVAVGALSVPIWLLLPHALIPRSVIPDGTSIVPPLFLPAFLAALAVAPLVVFWVIHSRRRAGA
jgi:hypothetical protein